jgi:hypothetical protein
MKDQILPLCIERDLLNQFQTGIKPGHSTTTALLKITYDISMNLNRKFFTILALHDLLQIL